MNDGAFCPIFKIQNLIVVLICDREMCDIWKRCKTEERGAIECHVKIHLEPISILSIVTRQNSCHK